LHQAVESVDISAGESVAMGMCEGKVLQIYLGVGGSIVASQIIVEFIAYLQKPCIMAFATITGCCSLVSDTKLF
jgi:hypothetical protein